MPKDEMARLVQDLRVRMKQAAKDLEFEKTALLRDAKPTAHYCACWVTP